MTIADSTIRHDVFTTIRGIVAGLSLTPSTTVVSALVPQNDNGVFPVVVIHPAKVPVEKASFDKSLKWKTIKVQIDVFAKNNEDLETIGDAIAAASSLYTISGLNFLSTDDNVAMSNEQNLQKIRMRSITFTYNRIGA